MEKPTNKHNQASLDRIKEMQDNAESNENLHQDIQDLKDTLGDIESQIDLFSKVDDRSRIADCLMIRDRLLITIIELQDVQIKKISVSFDRLKAKPNWLNRLFNYI